MQSFAFYLLTYRFSLFQTKMYIFIKSLSGRCYELDVDRNNTIGQIKQCLYDKSNIPPSLQLYIFAGRMLTNDKATISDWNLAKESTIHMVNWPNVRFYYNIVFENIKHNKILQVKLQPSSLVEDIKFQIQYKTWIPCDSIKVFFEDRELSDEEALIDSKFIL